MNTESSGQPVAASDVPHPQTASEIHQGLPPLESNQPPTSYFEFWPTKVFYIPVALHWIFLSLRYGGLTLPTIANPNFHLGGLVGDSKSQILGCATKMAKERISPFVTVAKSAGPASSESHAADLLQAQQTMANSDVSFPVVAKPDLGCRGAGVRAVKNQDDLADYLETFPSGGEFILQTLVPYEPEAGVFYVRHPGAEKGRIFSLTLKYFPYIIGDGTSNIKELILNDERAGQVPHLYLGRHKKKLKQVLPKGQPFRLAFAGSHSLGAIFRNGNKHITEEMCQAFDEIADGLPGFCFGRFDVRFPSIEELQNGGIFKVLEINGAGGEATHIWDSGTSLREAYRTLREQVRLVFQISAENRRRGHRPASLREVYRAYRKEGELTANYPSTD